MIFLPSVLFFARFLLFVFMSVFNNFAKWLRSAAFKCYWNGWKSLLLATKVLSRHISVLPLLNDWEPIYRFYMNHNLVTVKCRTRERTCATNTRRSTHWKLLFQVLVNEKGPVQPACFMSASLCRLSFPLVPWYTKMASRYAGCKETLQSSN